ncbi:4-hydroxy-4-methyl-2-oxoglutarate aldolase (plasmid) [Azospirillum baldaniorum]|uniref:4-hydroxy-4-methyl-2-oxoglutarate aldolase n=1 Tax=Azospirillum baldaniorum TaxID=1064539 RepID=A0A9P1JY87_9PROT|nr:4-carboxy-4-hydroxy-2-oxoadipate aldolase/oxaloacetate decarboxylase [Azospirillum baldaniorum]AWJ93890.1 4-hydroxy-4-methyl-2-oxoglutarate aldolase [Azospirillum baldaniorum]NUB06734.1 4-carboxy-4-hydroxy-2-oxoadipate aldolase/oxaloacetate decarboxylase [Azospirillum baldaniorum]TWA81720.1 4-hydroxy-4-methyl-2-oxoglutarate aldolase [Azospirillum brasilense]CCD02061.1 4-carboxy-4-hydroxy-2-oxoadipate aldolase [Azospirillum baldaniorum]
MTSIRTDFPRPTPEQVAAFATIGAATVHEALGRRGAVDSAIKPIWPGLRIVGAAFPLKTQPGDNLTIHAAMKLARPGDVLVVDAGDYTEQGSFGDVMATSAQSLGLAGLVTNGGVRDAAAIRDIGFPIFSRAISIKGTVKATLGPIAQPIVVGGVTVHPGDLIVGDDDGLVVVPLDEVEAVLTASRARLEKEERLRADLQSGKTTWDIGNYDALLAQTGQSLQA